MARFGVNISKYFLWGGVGRKQQISVLVSDNTNEIHPAQMPSVSVYIVTDVHAH